MKKTVITIYLAFIILLHKNTFSSVEAIKKLPDDISINLDIKNSPENKYEKNITLVLFHNQGKNIIRHNCKPRKENNIDFPWKINTTYSMKEMITLLKKFFEDINSNSNIKEKNEELEEINHKKFQGESIQTESNWPEITESANENEKKIVELKNSKSELEKKIKELEEINSEKEKKISKVENDNKALKAQYEINNKNAQKTQTEAKEEDVTDNEKDELKKELEELKRKLSTIQTEKTNQENIKQNNPGSIRIRYRYPLSLLIGFGIGYLGKEQIKKLGNYFMKYTVEKN